MMADSLDRRRHGMDTRNMPPEVAAYMIRDVAYPGVRFADNEYHINAPPGYCGDLHCVCADDARQWMNAEEWRLSYGTCIPADVLHRTGRFAL
jgi:hypothetical protein